MKEENKFYWELLFGSKTIKEMLDKLKQISEGEVIGIEFNEKDSLVGKFALSPSKTVKKITNAYKDQHGNIYILLEDWAQVIKYEDVIFLTEID